MQLVTIGCIRDYLNRRLSVTIAAYWWLSVAILVLCLDKSHNTSAWVLIDPYHVPDWRWLVAHFAVPAVFSESWIAVFFMSCVCHVPTQKPQTNLKGFFEHCYFENDLQKVTNRDLSYKHQTLSWLGVKHSDLQIPCSNHFKQEFLSNLDNLDNVLNTLVLWKKKVIQPFLYHLIYLKWENMRP